MTHLAIVVLATLVVLLLVAVNILLRRATVTRRANAPEAGESLRKLRPQANTYLWVKVRYKGSFVPLALTDNELMRSMTRGASNENDHDYKMPLDTSY
jgi:hypothetical protein